MDIIAFFIHKSLSSFTFPNALKNADVKPVFKKDEKTDKDSYRLINFLPTLSKANERLTYQGFIQAILISG